MSWLVHTAEGSTLLAAIVGVIGSIAISIGGWMLHAADEIHKLKLQALQDEIARTQKHLESADGKIETLHAAAETKIESMRLAAADYWTKREAENLRGELRGELARMTTRIDTGFTSINERLDRRNNP